MKINNKDITGYYDATFIHYKRWWRLSKAHAIHYGIWEDGVKSFGGSLLHTNKVLMNKAEIKTTDKVLDAGCGVGGSTLYIHQQKNAEVTGITLSHKQVEYANNLANTYGISDKVSFHVMDYTQTSFPDESFDVVWACESICHLEDKSRFITECYRILKKGGRLVLSDYFLPENNIKDKHQLIEKWIKTWSIPNLPKSSAFIQELETSGFQKTEHWDYSPKIKKSSCRMYYASLLGAIPSIIYNVLHPKASTYAKHHYRSGYFQYKALNKRLWQYIIILSTKQ